MLEQVEIANLRGIREGCLTELAPLTVLVGCNGAGKSTVLEAIAIGASHQPGEALGRTVAARGGWNGARWVVRRAASAEGASVAVTSGGLCRRVHISHDEGADAGEVGALMLSIERTAASAVPSDEGDTGALRTEVKFQPDNSYRFESMRNLGEWGRLHYLHPSSQRDWPLHRALQVAVETGRLDQVHGLLREVLGAEFRDLYPLPVGADGSVVSVHLRYADHSVPVAMAGDGVRVLVRLALELASSPGSVVLIEEPELHLHPAAIWLAAQALLAAVARGVQVILSTHSLELIDALSAQADDALRAQLCVYRLRTTAGTLLSWRISGAEVHTMRDRLGEDLR